MGLIPARAGNTRIRYRGFCLPRAHPRSRGEHSGNAFAQVHAEGSSPLARGTHDPPVGIVRRSGLIPARAGNTRHPKLPYRGRRAHPRSRGEHTIKLDSLLGLWGSSPLARGTHRLCAWSHGRFGLIPARAGNTCRLRRRRASRRAHPRSRGEHFSSGAGTPSIPGSSPLARGTLAYRQAQAYVQGLIPARAGSTRNRQYRFQRSGAHPRSRGEHSHPRGGERGVQGSSPLARGARVRGAAGIRWWGLIPARAGSTADVSASPDRQRAHPRSRGEHQCRRS